MAPVSSATEFEQEFNLIFSSTIDGDVPLAKYRSTKTGIHVVIAEVDGPLVSGHLCLATESHDDDGLPHTLEHLIFLGSEDHPYKGILDLLANRLLASGTNASTHQDSTRYLIETAGSEGFLALLPIYLDHVLYPILSEAAFVTEVHHINGEGEDAGVVYCEMQAIENTCQTLCYQESLRALFPGHCGYKANTGGVMLNLRESTSNDKVRNYHKEFYRPDNLCIVVCGQVKADQVFQSIKQFEEKIVAKGALDTYKRPWQSEVPTFDSTANDVMLFPCDEEKHGLVLITWRGPTVSQIEDILAISILLDYLTDKSVAPLQKEFVEMEDPFCSDVDYFIDNFSEVAIFLAFRNVPVKKLEEIQHRLTSVLKAMVTELLPFDEKRMATMVHRRRLHILKGMENQANRIITRSAVVDFLYGRNISDLKRRFSIIPAVDTLAKEPSTYWLGLLKTLQEKPFVAMVGKPSLSLSKLIAEEEKQRVKLQRETLGEEGLKAKKEELEKAIAQNEIEPPKSLLTSVAIPNVDCIKFHEINRSCSYQTDLSNSKVSFEELPCRFQLDDLHSMFVTLSVFVNLGKIPEDLRLYIPLWTELVTESPVFRDGALIPFEQIVSELTSDTLGSFVGISQPQSAVINLCVEKEKYQKGISWLKDLLYNTQFIADRIGVIATKMFFRLSEEKREGYCVVSDLHKDLVYKKETTHWIQSVFRQEKFLEEIQKTLETTPAEVIGALNRLRAILTEPGNLTIHLATDVKALEENNINLTEPWKNLFKTPVESRKCAPNIIQSHNLLKHQPASGVITGIGSVESSYLLQSVYLGLDYNHPDLPALYILNQYLTQLEGPLWKELRGHGLTYHYDISYNTESGLLSFLLYKATHLVSAYKEAKNIVDKHLYKSETIWEESLLESSQSSFIFELVSQESTVPKTSTLSQIAFLRGYDFEYRKKLLAAIPKVTIADMQRVGALYLTQLFDASKTNTAACCNPSKVDQVVAGFNELSKDLTVIQSIEGVFAKY